MRLPAIAAVLNVCVAVCSASAQDCLVVCPPPLRAALDPWIANRHSQGLTLSLVDSAPSAAAVTENLVRAGLGPETQFVMLVGDCRLAASGAADPQWEVPTYYRPPGPTAGFGTTPTLAGDAPYGDLDGDGVPEVGVGRLPVDSAEQLASLVTRILAYEGSKNFGLWRDRVEITAGVGGFGFFADAAIESATRSVLTSALPEFIELGVTYASPTSPFNPGRDDFFPSVLRRYREGSLFWVYLGHGQVTELDNVPGPGNSLRPVLCCEDVGMLECAPGVAPIAVMLACYAGAFDASEDALAERMLLADGGPVAVLAGSRVTMPYGNAVAAQGLIHAVYHDRAERLGTAWMRAQRELATATGEDTPLAERRKLVDLLARALSPTAETLAPERLEHIHLYNLLGDPTLRLAHPDELQIEAPRGVAPGGSLSVRGVAPREGRLTVSLSHPPGNVPVDRELSQFEQYEQSNAPAVATVELARVPSGPFEVRLAVPADVRGPFKIVARLQSDQGWSTAAAPLLVRPD